MESRAEMHDVDARLEHSVDEHLLEELRFAKFIVKYPCALCWIVLAILMGAAMVNSQVADMGENMFGPVRITRIFAHAVDIGKHR